MLYLKYSGAPVRMVENPCCFEDAQQKQKNRTSILPKKKFLPEIIFGFIRGELVKRETAISSQRKQNKTPEMAINFDNLLLEEDPGFVALIRNSGTYYRP